MELLACDGRRPIPPICVFQKRSTVNLDEIWKALDKPAGQEDSVRGKKSGSCTYGGPRGQQNLAPLT